MSRVLALLALCIVLAVVRAVLIVVAVVAGLALLYAFVRKPRETLIFIGVMTLSVVASAQPLAAIVAIGTAGVVVTLSGRRRSRDD
jgi:hypothetical protein